VKLVLHFQSRIFRSCILVDPAEQLKQNLADDWRSQREGGKWIVINETEEDERDW